MSTYQTSKQTGQFVGAKIRAARQAKKYTQSKLAAPDFSVSYISAIERGQIQPSLRALEILARRLDLSSTQLLPEHVQLKNGNDSMLSTPMNEEMAIELALLEAQIHILQGAAIQAIAHLKHLSDKNLQHRHQIQQRYLLGWAYLHTAQFQKCENALSEAQKLAAEQNDHYSSLHTYNLLGLAYAAMRNHQRALQSHQNCLKLLEMTQPQDPFFLCQVYTHLGQHYSQLSNYSSAIDMFKQAIAIAEELVALKDIQSVYWNISQYYANTSEYALAILYSHKCLHLHNQQKSLPTRSEIYHYLGRALMKSDQEQARTYLEQALQQANNLQDPLTHASITLRLAEWHLVHNNLQEAEQYAERAYELARPSGNTIIAVEALLIWGRIQYAQQAYEAGDTHFVAGLDMLQQLQLHEELSDQSASYAQLLDQRNKAQEALTYYKRAFESRRMLWEYVKS